MDAVGFGRSLRALRQRRGWRQRDLAEAAGVSRSLVARIEQGLGDRVPPRTLATIGGALGGRVIVRLDWNGEALDRLLDHGHAATVERVVSLLTSWGWITITEASFNVRGERGSVDILAFHPASSRLLVVEVKTVLPDVGPMLMTLDRKVRLAPVVARERGWPATASVDRLLVVVDGRTARRRVEAVAATFRTTFPVQGRAVRAWLARPGGLPFAGMWFLSPDHQAVVSRRHRIRRPASPHGDGPTSRHTIA